MIETTGSLQLPIYCSNSQQVGQHLLFLQQSSMKAEARTAHSHACLVTCCMPSVLVLLSRLPAVVAHCPCVIAPCSVMATCFNQQAFL